MHHRQPGDERHPFAVAAGVGILGVYSRHQRPDEAQQQFVVLTVDFDVADMCALFEKGNIERCEDLHYKMFDLVKAMFVETNPIPVKTAMGLMKMIAPEMRLPLCEMLPENREKLMKVLKEYGLIS